MPRLTSLPCAADARRDHEPVHCEALTLVGRGIAHDLGNLLSIIVGSADLATSSADSGADHIDAIRRAAEHASRLTHQISTLGRRPREQDVIVDLNEVIRDCEVLIRSILSPDIELEVSPQPGPLPVPIAAPQLERVLLNLCINAKDAMPEGGRVSISTTRTAREQLAHAAAWTELTVRDTGPGVDPALRDLVFEPFFTTKREGTGLGLSTIVQILRDHGGRLRLDETWGSGASFVVALPSGEEDSASRGPERVRRAPLGEATRRSSERARLLLVEDDLQVRTILSRLLERKGFDVTGAASAEQALRALRTSPADVVLSDLQMPGRGGLWLEAQVAIEHPGTPCLLMSGDIGALPGVMKRVGRSVRVLSKPVSSSVLVAAIREALGAARRDRT